MLTTLFTADVADAAICSDAGMRFQPYMVQEHADNAQRKAGATDGVSVGAHGAGPEIARNHPTKVSTVQAGAPDDVPVGGLGEQPVVTQLEADVHGGDPVAEVLDNYRVQEPLAAYQLEPRARVGAQLLAENGAEEKRVLCEFLVQEYLQPSHSTVRKRLNRFTARGRG